ncbi:hypothetical protein [Corticibacter populi]|uniref:hypothetical protein n=1 Tax=Corticibacter populi TaxID=1550736 RepID=UPI00102C4348|nr:hypothetical protein [Corticibacter populi]
MNTKEALASAEAFLLFIDIERWIGCSLKIHRVESALLMERREISTVPSAMILIASKTNIQCESKE